MLCARVVGSAIIIVLVLPYRGGKPNLTKELSTDDSTLLSSQSMSRNCVPMSGMIDYQSLASLP